MRGTQRSHHNIVRAGIARLPLALSVIFVTGLLTAYTVHRAHAASPGDIVINEIMYNPASGNSLDEFLELHNTTASPIDLQNWSFSQGIVLNFASSTIVPANGYIVISPNSAQTLATYGVTSSATYTGNLSNGGEVVTLLDNTSAVVDTVNYDDAAPWPTSPDGYGYSLELKNPTADNALAENWVASTVLGGSPAVVNGAVAVNVPEITNVNDPNDVGAGQDVTINATIAGSGITSVDLKYKINFDADQTVAMADDGLHDDGAASDGVYGATIPGQAIKTLVRFKVEATNAGGTQSSPSANESITYDGYYVKDPSVSSTMPIIEWFMDDGSYNDMVTNHQFDNMYFSCVVVYGNDVYDNAVVRVKGDATRNDAKHSLKFKLPSGYTISLPGLSGRKLGEFHMDGEMWSGTQAEVPTAWWVMAQTGLPTTDMQPASLHRNGEFDGVYIFLDKYEKEWRKDNNLNTGDLFENFLESVSGPNDATARNDWRATMLQDPKDPSTLDAVLDTVNLPNAFNYAASDALMSCWDHFYKWNSFLYHDSAKTGRWSTFHWDLDSCFDLYDTKQFISPLDYIGDGGSIEQRYWGTSAFYAQPTIRPLYLRRLKTLVDKLYSNDELLNKYNEYYDMTHDDMQLDLAKWGSNNRNSRTTFDNAYRRLKQNLTIFYDQPWLLPPSQTDADRQSVSIAEVHASADNTDEFIRLSSSGDTPVDVSGWQVEGIDYTIPAGAVVPAHGSLYLLRDDAGYRAGHSAVLVAGQYDNDLGSSGSLVLKTDQNVIIDTHAY